MRSIAFFLLLFYTACTLPEEKKARQVSEISDSTVIESHDLNAAAQDTTNNIPLPAVQKIKAPNGVYQALINDNKVQQTIAFKSDLTYQLQEKYTHAEKDSVVTTEGSWMPSDGFIWLYKDQVARGRYKWKGDTLLFYSPALKKNFSMHHLKEASENLAWKNKSKEGIVFFATGTEPFWNIQLDSKDSISLLLADWQHPLKFKADSNFSNKDSTGYLAKNDSAQIRVTIFPHFCSDGMSDYVYRNKIKVQLNQKVYNGCALLYK